MAKNNNDISAIAVADTIQIHFQDGHLNIQKSQNPDLFERVFKLVAASNIKELKKQFFDIKKELEKYTKGEFRKGDNGQMFLKGDSEPIPTILAKKLMQFRDEKKDFMPLVRFWKKLKENPDARIRERLYAFLSHNNIPISPLGDVICEKGVKELPNGKLVDKHTGTIDNSIGMVVKVAREKVVVDPNQTCAAGLHVGAPDYVRNHWTSGIIIEVSVNPADFVAIPTDYNATKARVCRYQVLGLAQKENKGILYNFDDIIAPTYGEMEKQKKRGNFSSSDANDHSEKNANDVDFSKMTAKAIIEYVKRKYSHTIKRDPKNKKAIIKEAEDVMSKSQNAPSNVMERYIKDIVTKGECTYSNNGTVLKFTAQEIKDYVANKADVPKFRSDKLKDISNKNKTQIIKLAYQILKLK